MENREKSGLFAGKSPLSAVPDGIMPGENGMSQVHRRFRPVLIPEIIICIATTAMIRPVRRISGPSRWVFVRGN